jgi:predicted DNA-binding protein (MmcQ/YjbR family)
MSEAAITHVREICMALPGATERASHGEPAWFVKDKRQFAMFANHHHDDRVAVWIAARPGTQEGLIASDPTRFFRPPYVGPRGWVGIWLDVEVDWNEVSDLIEDAFRHITAKRS